MERNSLPLGQKSATFLNIGYGKIVTTREPDRLVRLTDVRTGRELATLTKTVGGINDEGYMTFSPDGKRVAFHGSGKKNPMYGGQKQGMCLLSHSWNKTMKTMANC